MNAKLYRSRTDAVIGGVCGGLGQYLGIDSTWVRVFFLLLALGSGIGVFIYLLLWVIVPREGAGEMGSQATIREGTEEIAARARELGGDLGSNLARSNQPMGKWIGVGLIALGVIFLAQNLAPAFLAWLRFDFLWPLLLVVGGLVLIWRQVKGA